MLKSKIPTPGVGGSMGLNRTGVAPCARQTAKPIGLEQPIEAGNTATGRHWLANESEALS